MCLTFSIDIFYIVYHCTWNALCFLPASSSCSCFLQYIQKSMTRRFFLCSYQIGYNHTIESRLVAETWIAHLYSSRLYRCPVISICYMWVCFSLH